MLIIFWLHKIPYHKHCKHRLFHLKSVADEFKLILGVLVIAFERTNERTN